MVSWVAKSKGIQSHTINLGTRVKDLARVMGESRKMNTVFLAGNRFIVFALFHVINMHTIIVPGSDQNVALVIKVQRGHVFGRVFFTRVEPLQNNHIRMVPQSQHSIGHTLDGLKVSMISVIFCDLRGAWAGTGPC